MKKINFIVYNTTNHKIIETFHQYDEDTQKALCKSMITSEKKMNVDYVNVGSPRHQETLKVINQVNNTEL